MADEGRLTSWNARYLIAHFAKSNLWHTSALLFAFFLTEVCNLSILAMGWIMAGTLLINGMCDALCGFVWGRRKTKAVDLVRLQLIGAPLACLFFGLFCATPIFTPTAQVWWALAALVGFRASYSLIDVAQNSLVALTALSEKQRNTLLAKRNIASGLAALTVSGLAAPLLIINFDVLVWLGWACGLSVFVCGTAWWLARPQICDPVAAFTSSQAANQRGETSFPWLLAAMAALVMASTMFRLLEPYFGAYVGNGICLLVSAAIGGLVSQPLRLIAQRRTTPIRALSIVLMMLMGTAICLSTGMRTTGLGAVIAGLGFGLGTGGLWLTLWASMTRRAASGDATIYVGVFTCVSKLAQAAATLLVGQLLAKSDYRSVFGNPMSLPSLIMASVPISVALLCILLTVLQFSREGCRETRVTQPPMVPPDQERAGRRRAS